MAKTRELVKRRRAIRNIRKITRTMELIATARFKKAMDRATEAAAFTQKIAELAAELSANAVTITHPLLENREVIEESVLLVLCSNRGLCGGYNTSILREAFGALREMEASLITPHLELSGKRAINAFKSYPLRPEKTFTKFEDRPAYEDVEAIANRYLQAYISGEIDRVQVAYMKFLSAARQVPVVETLLPLSSVGGMPGRPTAPGGEAGPAKQVEYEFLPDTESLLADLLPTSFKVRLYKCFLDAAVSEQIARRVTMKAATENADDIIKNVTRLYNRARQAQITKEISEVIAGSEALK